MLFLHPGRIEGRISQYLDIGKDPYPDVVLEVDSTTDVRRNRLKLYEEWGFPELWVEVPNAYAPSRPAGLRSGLRIHLLERGRYAPSETSRAFPGLAGRRDPSSAQRAGPVGGDLGGIVAGGSGAGGTGRHGPGG